jgi:hypothetical protein
MRGTPTCHVPLPRLPRGDDAGMLPARDFCDELRVLRGEVLRAVIALPAVTAARAHSPRCAAAFVEHLNAMTGGLQCGGAGKAGDAGANHGDVVCSFHSGALHSGWGRDRRRNCDRLVRNLLAFHRASQQVDDASKTTLAPEALFVLVKI